MNEAIAGFLAVIEEQSKQIATLTARNKELTEALEDNIDQSLTAEQYVDIYYRSIQTGAALEVKP